MFCICGVYKRAKKLQKIQDRSLGVFKQSEEHTRVEIFVSPRPRVNDRMLEF